MWIDRSIDLRKDWFGLVESKRFESIGSCRIRYVCLAYHQLSVLAALAWPLSTRSMAYVSTHGIAYAYADSMRSCL